MALAGALPDGPCCLTRSRIGYRMSEKTGVLLRGPGRAALGPAADPGASAARAHLTVSPTRVTHWRGKDARTLSTATTGART